MPAGLLKWFEENQMKSNPDKCHLLMSVNEHVTITIIASEEITKSRIEKRLRKTFATQLKLENQINVFFNTVRYMQ